MARGEDAYKTALAGKKIPPLVLDNKWHQLFTQAETIVSPDIRRQEERLNDLIKRQGKLNTETKDLRRLKKKLMAEIMELSEVVDQVSDSRIDKKMEDNRRLIRECNDKMEAYALELKSLPAEIDSINYRLMLVTMEICYQKINDNTKEIDQISNWIADIRVEMKKRLIRKEERESANFNLYSYMHDIFGADVIEIFDMKYNPAEKNKSASDSEMI